ncbi:hypothetical protein, partial [Rufibacter soli]
SGVMLYDGAIKITNSTGIKFTGGSDLSVSTITLTNSFKTFVDNCRYGPLSGVAVNVVSGDGILPGGNNVDF